ncbi:MAG TPA: hypothetical protein VJX66_19465 [Amycolatopsis sp.]|nr:hypothetical protein [Amycolatopsis sp.]
MTVALAVTACLLTACTADSSPAAPPTLSPPTTEGPPPAGLAGMRTTGGIGVQVVLATAPPSLFDADHGTTRALSGYPGGDQAVIVQRVGGTPVVLTNRRCLTGDCDPFTVLVHAGQDGPPRSLGKAWSVAAAADQKSVWLIRQDAPRVCRLQHVSLTGTEYGHGQPASCTTSLRGETSRGLLISINSDTAQSEDALIEPETGRTVRQFPRIEAVAGDRMLVSQLADFAVIDLGTGVTKTVPRPTATGDPLSFVSRDGLSVAVEFANPAWHGTSVQVRDIWLLDLDTLRWERAPGMPYQTENLKMGGLDWSADGDLVLADGVLAAWHPGEPSWRLGAAALPPDFQSGLAVIP